MILDYQNFVTRSGHRGVVNYKSVDQNIDVFNSTSLCPFCKETVTQTVYQKEKLDYPGWLFGSFNEWEEVKQCPICGWWEYKYHNQSDAVDDGIAASDIKIVTSILRQYSESSRSIPIQTLNAAIAEYPEKIYEIHDKKMEELVQSVFSSYYSCNVSLVGKSHDGGKDLIFVESDRPTFVQVKRRISPNKVEAVSGIRELLGATLLADNVKSCIFVSTADHFSLPAQKEAQRAVEKCLVEKYELFDCTHFLNMLQLTKKDIPVSWSPLLTL